MKELENITVTEISDVGVIKHLAGRKPSMQNRRFYGVSFSLGGEIVYDRGGEKTVSDLGVALIHPKGANYEFTCVKGGEFGLINFLAKEDFADRFIALKIPDMKLFKAKFYELREAALTGASRLHKLRLFYEIIEQLTSDIACDSDTVLAVAKNEAQKRYTSPTFDVKALASSAHVSESYLRRVFSDELGVSPKKYLTALRMARAKTLLADGRDGVAVIAAECGFASVYNFCRAFKETVGETPTEYRKSHGPAVQM